MAENDDKQSENSDVLKKISETQATIAEALKELKSGNTSAATALAERIESALTAMKPASGDDDDDNDDDDDDVDLEGMSRKELVAHLKNKLAKEYRQDLRNLQEETSQASNAAQTAAIKQEIADCKKEHPDFDEWKPELAAIAKRYPDLSIEDMYTMAVAKHPEKAADLAEKFKKDGKRSSDGGKKSNDDDEDETQGTRFGGMRPGGGRDVTFKDRKFKNIKEAGNAVFDELFGADYK